MAGRRDGTVICGLSARWSTIDGGKAHNCVGVAGTHVMVCSGVGSFAHDQISRFMSHGTSLQEQKRRKWLDKKEDGSADAAKVGAAARIFLLGTRVGRARGCYSSRQAAWEEVWRRASSSC